MEEFLAIVKLFAGRGTPQSVVDAVNTAWK